MPTEPDKKEMKDAAAIEVPEKEKAEMEKVQKDAAEEREEEGGYQ